MTLHFSDGTLDMLTVICFCKRPPYLRGEKCSVLSLLYSCYDVNNDFCLFYVFLCDWDRVSECALFLTTDNKLSTERFPNLGLSRLRGYDTYQNYCQAHIFSPLSLLNGVYRSPQSVVHSSRVESSLEDMNGRLIFLAKRFDLGSGLLEHLLQLINGKEKLQTRLTKEVYIVTCTCSSTLHNYAM